VVLLQRPGELAVRGFNLIPTIGRLPPGGRRPEPPLVVSTTLLTTSLCGIAFRTIHKRVKEFFALFLLWKWVWGVFIPDLIPFTSSGKSAWHVPAHRHLGSPKDRRSTGHQVLYLHSGRLVAMLLAFIGIYPAPTLKSRNRQNALADNLPWPVAFCHFCRFAIKVPLWPFTPGLMPTPLPRRVGHSGGSC
jgi:NADH:ubiquinone oxidoreductase subunit 4 (subunit M)